MPTLPPRKARATLIRRHLRLGWGALLIFLCLGLCLEVLHGFKLRFYLDVSNETRRLMLRLAHAHGALLGLVNLAFAGTLALAPRVRVSKLAPEDRWKRWALASGALGGATVAMPLGFLLGGLFAHAADPGLGVVLVPLAAVLLGLAVATVLWEL